MTRRVGIALDGPEMQPCKVGSLLQVDMRQISWHTDQPLMILDASPCCATHPTRGRHTITSNVLVCEGRLHYQDAVPHGCLFRSRDSVLWGSTLKSRLPSKSTCPSTLLSTTPRSAHDPSARNHGYSWTLLVQVSGPLLCLLQPLVCTKFKSNGKGTNI